MLANLMLFPLATLLTPTHVRPNGLPASAVAMRTAADTGAGDDLTRTPLTDELLTHYIGVKKDLGEFWKAPANKALHDSAMTHHHVHKVTVTVPGMQLPSADIGAFDYVDLTSREPAIAAIFKKNGLAPQQFEATQVAVVRASFASEVKRLTGKVVDDPSSVAGKNVALVDAHKQDLTAVGAFAKLQTGGGGGGGRNDLNP